MPPLDRSLFAGSFLVGLAPFAAAQIPVPNQVLDYDPMLVSDTMSWNESEEPTFKRLVAGDFSADGVEDVAVHDGANAFVWHDAVVLTLCLPVDNNVLANDIDTVRGVNGLGDRLALVNSAGLHEAIWPSQSMVQASVVAVSTTNPSEWYGALKVRCGDVDKDGVDDYVGVASDGVSILRLYSGTGQATSRFTPPSGEQDDIHDIALLQWDTDTALEVAVATDAGLRIYDLSSATFGYKHAHYDSSAVCRRIGILAGTSRDRCAWSVEDVSNDEIHVVRYGLSLESVVLESGMRVVGLSGADADADGDNDIMFNTTLHLAPIFLSNAFPNTPSFSTTLTPDWDLSTVDDALLLGANGANNVCPPLFKDFNFDGRADLFLALEQTGASLNLNPRFAFLPWVAQKYPSVKPPPLWSSGGVVSNDIEVNGLLNLRSFNLRIDPEDLPDGANALEVKTYRQRTDTFQLEPEVLTWSLHLYPTLGEGDHIRLEFDLDQENACFASAGAEGTNIYWFDVWPRVWNPSTSETSGNYAHRIAAVGAGDADVCAYLCGTDVLTAVWFNHGFGTVSPANCTGASVANCDEGNAGAPSAHGVVVRPRLPPAPTPIDQVTVRAPGNSSVY
jgi:hypothetical protein